MKKLLLKNLVLSLFALNLAACGTTEEAYFIEEDPAAVSFSDESPSEEAEVVLDLEPSPTVPVVVNLPPQSSLPPAPTPGTPGVIVAPAPPGNNNNPVDLRPNTPNGLEGGLTLNAETSVPLLTHLETYDGEKELSLQYIYQDPATTTSSDGLAHISYVSTSSGMTLYQTLIRSNPNLNRLEGEIRVRFPRGVQFQEVNRSGSFVELEMTSFFPTDWIRWHLKGCLPGGSCRIIKRDISLQDVPGSACDPDANSSCDKALKIEINEDELPTENFNAYEKFQISVEGTNEADYRDQQGHIRICSNSEDCLSSHPYCVAGVCSAIYPGNFLETNQL